MFRTTKTLYRAFVEPEFELLAGSRRRRASGPVVAAAALAGVVLGSLLAGYTGHSFPAGVFAGGVGGLAAWQLAARRRTRR